MKRLKYISELNKFFTENPEVYVQNVLPKCILKEIYYFQRFGYKELELI